jgi:hyperosmotically inducible periplasmic protein
MKTLIVLLVLIALGGGLYWYTKNGRLRQAEDQAAQRAEQVKSAITDKLKGISLDTASIKEELARSGKVVRKKAEELGSAIADATADTRITATIKAKLVKDPNLSALRIGVNTTAGVVTLSGSVDSVDQIQQSLKLALETDGVREAISTLQVTTVSPKTEPRNPK